MPLLPEDQRNPPVTQADERQFAAFYRNVAPFIDTVLAGPLMCTEDFVPGTQKIDLFEQYTQGTSIKIDDYREQSCYSGLTYENAVFHRLRDPKHPGILILLGGLGAGKSTSMHHLEYLFVSHKDEIDRQFPCSCSPCRRRPLYVDLHLIDREFTPDQAIARVYKDLRFSLYSRLIEEWLQHNGLEPADVQAFDGGYKVLRRIMLINDLQDWAQTYHPGEYPLSLEIIEFTGKALFQRTSVSVASLRAVVEELGAESARVAHAIAGVTANLKDAADFTSLLLRFYASRCSPVKPSSVVMIDNLDQLPTDTIERIADQLSVFATRGPIPPLLVPLRPSSLAPRAFERLPAYMYHYGPDCFELMLRRLQKYVLDRSYASLSGGVDKDPLPKVFVTTPAQDEVFAFLVATYLYAKIVTAGLSPDAATRLSGGFQRLPSVHADFAANLESMQVAEGALHGLSETIGALVGTCARYATAQITQYYQSLYRRPEVLSGCLKGGITLKAFKALNFGYRQLIGTVLSYSEPGEPERIANLYRASLAGANAGLPSLVKIRLLVELASQKKATVRQLLRTLALYGIPQELGILGLNYLHDKPRLLVWFSKNSDLLGSDADLDQSVTISEHGISYLRHVLGDFEYIWFCATEIPARLDRASDPDFAARLGHYTRLMQGIALTEWKQLAFVRCIERETADESSVINSHRMLALFILYSSLERAIKSARFTLGVRPKDSIYYHDVARLITGVCALILASQERYRMCYHSTQYLVTYYDILVRAKPALRALLDAAVLDQDQEDLVQILLSSWEERPPERLATSAVIDTGVPRDGEFTETCLRCARGLVPGLLDTLVAIEGLNTYQRPIVKILLWRFLRGRALLFDGLERRLPLYSTVERTLGVVVNAAQDILATRSNPELAAIIAVMGFEWIASETEWLESRLTDLRKNAFQIETLTGYAQLDSAKRKMNAIMDTYSAVARRLGVASTEHLDIKWM